MNEEPIRFRGVEFSQEGIRETGRQIQAIRIRGDLVRGAEIRLGSRSVRPVPQMLLGGLAAAVGVLPLARVVRGLTGSGPLRIEAVLLAGLVAFGLWLIRTAVGRAFRLLVRTDEGLCVIVLDGGADPEGIEEFAEAVRGSFGLDIHVGDVRRGVKSA